MSNQPFKRKVLQTVDGNGVYFSRLASAGPWVFLAGTAMDESGALAPETEIKIPYQASQSAHVRAQTDYILGQYRAGLEELGGSFDDIVQVEQYVPYKAYADGYLEVRNSPKYMDHDRCSSALMQSGDLYPAGAVIQPTAIAVAAGYGIGKEVTFSAGPKPALPIRFGTHYAKESPTGEITLAGPYVYTTITAVGGLDDVHPDVKVPAGVWWGNEIRNELRFGLEALKVKLGVVGSDVSNAMHCTVHLTHIDDLYEFDLIWREVFGDNPPARTVVPMRGLFMPRAEGAKGHRDNAIRMELQFRSIRPGYGIEKETIETDLDTFGEEPVATRAGSLLWVSGQLGATLSGVVGDGSASAQIGEIIRRLKVITSAAGTELGQALRLRAYLANLDDAPAIYAAIKAEFPQNPPAVAVVGTEGEFAVPGCSIMIDAVVHVPGEHSF